MNVIDFTLSISFILSDVKSCAFVDIHGVRCRAQNVYHKLTVFLRNSSDENRDESHRFVAPVLLGYDK